MNSSNARRIGLVLLVVLSLGVAAATLQSTVGDTPGDGGGAGGGTGEGSPGEPGGDDAAPPRDNVGGMGGQSLCFRPALSSEFKLGVLGLIAAVTGVMAWRYEKALALPIAGAFGLMVLAVYAILVSQCGELTPDSMATNVTRQLNRTVGDVGRAGGDAGQAVATNPFLTGAVFLAAVLLLGAVAYLHNEDAVRAALAGNPTSADDEEPEEETDRQALAGLASVAGQAADRIEDDATVDNEIYRAWKGMTDHLDVERPESSTPGEFAAAATDAGMAPRDVAELTRLFEAVRYGGSEPTAEREDRALEALRNIEAGYSDDEEVA